MSDADSPAEDLWRFALAVYGASGVSAACLELQDRFGADVPVLLTALWMGRRGRALDAAAMAALDGVVADWRAEMVQPLRALRRRLKSGPAPAPSDTTEALRSEIKRAELSAEKIEMVRLAEWAAAQPEAEGQGDAARNLALAVAYFAERAEVPEALLAPLLEAAEAN
ncbi:TIGR02444 family protein [Roseivivax sp.]